MMELSEKAIDYLETPIPELAELALKKAYWQTLASGNSVTVLENDEIVEISPEGIRKVIKKISRSSRVNVQKHYMIRS
jgi:hypothetical protein